MQRGVTKGVLHRNTVARKLSASAAGSRRFRPDLTRRLSGAGCFLLRSLQLHSASGREIGC